MEQNFDLLSLVSCPKLDVEKFWLGNETLFKVANQVNI